MTDPPSRNTGRSDARRSSVVSRRGPSSTSTRTVSPRRPLAAGASTETISRANVPASWAATARRCDSSANASWSARVTSWRSATFSAVSPIPSVE